MDSYHLTFGKAVSALSSELDSFPLTSDPLTAHFFHHLIDTLALVYNGKNGGERVRPTGVPALAHRPLYRDCVGA